MAPDARAFVRIPFRFRGDRLLVFIFLRGGPGGGTGSVRVAVAVLVDTGFGELGVEVASFGAFGGFLFRFFGFFLFRETFEEIGDLVDGLRAGAVSGGGGRSFGKGYGFSGTTWCGLWYVSR